MPPSRRARRASAGAAPGWVFIAVVVLVALWLGPWPLVAGVVLLVVPPLRRAVREAVTPRGALAVVALVLSIVLAAVLLPAGMLPVPSGPGVLVGPSYRGSPVDPPRTATTRSAGFLGDRTGVRTAWYGVSGCTQVLPVGSSGRRLLVRCGGAVSSDLRLVDAGTLRVRSRVAVLRGATCRTCVVGVAADRVLVATPRTLQTVLVGDRLRLGPALRTGLPDGDAVAALGRDGSAVRWVSRAGRTGTVTAAGRSRPGRDLPDGSGGSGRSGGSDVRGRTSTVAGARLLEVHGADGPEDLSRLDITDLRSGRRGCRVALGAGSPVGAPTVAGDVVVVATDRAVVRVSLARCRVVWRSGSVHPACGPGLSVAVGEVYVCDRRLDWRGVWAWYAAALSLRTGELDVARRTGTGPLAAPRSAVAPAPSRAAYVGVRAGILRVRDAP